MSNAERKNLFDNINETRKRKIINDGKDVASSYVATQVENKIDKKSLESILNKSTKTKEGYNYYLEQRIDTFLEGMKKITGNSKSDIMNQLMIMLIEDSEIVDVMASSDKKIQKLVDEFKS